MTLREWAWASYDFGYYKTRYPWYYGRHRYDPYIFRAYYDEDYEVRSICSESYGSVHRIQNQFLWGCYQLKYDEKCAYYGYNEVQEHIMFHVTSPENALDIAEANFDWRLKYRSRYGHGVCFSYTERYGYQYSSKYGATLVCGVLIAGTNIGSRRSTLPSTGSDTTVDPFENVVVKYYDHEFYPYYIIYQV